MASQQSTIDSLLDSLSGAGRVTARKMFGEYCVYLDDKPVALVCVDNAFANIYSTAVSLQNVVRVGQRTLAVGVGIAAFVFAISIDLVGYETFLLLFGGIFVSLFGVLCADYYATNSGKYDTDELYRENGRYWFTSGINTIGVLAWTAGFATYAACGQPPWLVEHTAWITNTPDWMTRLGGTIPSFAVSFLLYVALSRISRTTPPATAPKG